MKKLLLSFVVVVTSLHGLAGQTLVPYRQNQLWGYADESGKILIKPKYAIAHFFRPDGYATVSVDTVFTLIDKSGKEYLSGKYTAVFEFANGRAAVCKGGKYSAIQGEVVDGKWGYINENFEEVIPCNYARAQSFVDDYAIVQTGDNWGKWGLIDKTGKVILPFVYQTYSFDMRPFPGLIWGFVKGSLQRDVTNRGEVWETIDMKGKTVGIPYKAMHGKPTYYEKPQSNYNSDFPQKTGPLKLRDAAGKLITINRKGTSDWSLGYDMFSIGIPASDPPSDSNPNEKKYALVNRKGSILVPFGKYDSYNWCENGMILVTKGNRYGFVESGTGKEVVAPKYDFAGGFSNGYAHVYYNYASICNRADGYINKQGKEFFSDDPVVNVVAANGVMMLDEHKNLLMPSWISPNDNMSVSGNSIMVTNTKGMLLALGKIEGKVNRFESLQEYLCRSSNVDKIDIQNVDSVARRIKRVDFTVDPGVSITTTAFNETLFLLAKDEKVGLMDSNGKVLLPVVYTAINPTASVAQGFVPSAGQAAFFVTLENGRISTHDATGKEILRSFDNIEDHVSPNGNATFVVVDGDLRGSFSDRGKELLPAKYSRIETLDETSRYQVVTDNNERTGVAKNYSEMIVPNIYSDVSLITFRKRVYFLVYGKYTLLLDTLGKTVVPKEYAHGDLSPQELDIHDDNQPMYFTLFKKGKWGAFREGKGLIIPISKHSLDIYGVNERAYFIVQEKKQGPYGLLDDEGKVVLQSIYSNIDLAGSGDVMFTAMGKDGKTYNLTKDHKVIEQKEE